MAIKPKYLRKPDRHERRRAWSIARSSWIRAGGDERKAKQYAKTDLRAEFGSIVLYLTIAAILLQICYTLFKLWKETRTLVPATSPTPDELLIIG